MHFVHLVNKQDGHVDGPELENRDVEDQVNSYLYFHDIKSCAFLANHYSRKHCHTVCKQFILVMIGTLVYFQRAIILERLFTQFARTKHLLAPLCGDSYRQFVQG